MSDTIVYVDRSTVREGKQDELETAIGELVEFIEANVPRMLAYDVYFSPDGGRMTVMHVHADSASLAEHMRVAGPEFPRFGELIELEAIEVYGRPNEELVDRLRAKASELGTGTVSIHERHRGFSRFGGS